MSLTNNPIELLVILGVNSTKSLDNINAAITKLQSDPNLKKLQVEIDIKAQPDFVKNLAKNLSQQLKSVQNDAENLNATLGNLGAGTGNKHNNFGSMRTEINKTFTSLKELEHYLKSNNYKYNIEFKIDDDGRKIEKSVTAYMKNAYGEIERLNFAPVIDASGAVRSFKEVGAAVQNVDTFKLQDNIRKSTVALEDFGRKGLLAAKDYTHFQNSIRNATTNQELERVNAELQKFAKDIAFDNTFANKVERAKNSLYAFANQGKLAAADYNHFKKAIENSKTSQELEKVLINMNEMANHTAIGDKLGKSITSVNLQIDKLNESMDRFMRKNARNADASAFGRYKDELSDIQRMLVGIDSRGMMDVQKRLKQVSAEITTATTSANDLKQFDARAKQINKYIGDIEVTTVKSKKAIAAMYKVIGNTPRGDLNRLEVQFAKIESIAARISKREMIIQGIKTNINNVVALNAQLERAYNMNKRHANKDDYKKLVQEIDRLSKMRIKESADVKRLDDAYKALRQRISAFNAAATQESRNNMTLLNQLKIAMERFPIWMIASTAFYGVVRTTRAFIDTLVEIDTKLVSIEKVAGSSGIDSIFDSAVESAERFGQSVSQVLDAFTEFARQGYKGQDLINLSDAGLVTANVGEMTAQQASEYLTSALIQWNRETSEGMEIIDSWNELANNYATTVEKLARGHARAGATAASIGLEFDQLNAILGTV